MVPAGYDGHWLQTNGRHRSVLPRRPAVGGEQPGRIANRQGRFERDRPAGTNLPIVSFRTLLHSYPNCQ